MLDNSLYIFYELPGTFGNLYQNCFLTLQSPRCLNSHPSRYFRAFELRILRTWSCQVSRSNRSCCILKLIFTLKLPRNRKTTLWEQIISQLQSLQGSKLLSSWANRYQDPCPTICSRTRISWLLIHWARQSAIIFSEYQQPPANTKACVRLRCLEIYNRFW